MALLELAVNGLQIDLEAGQSLGVPGGWGAGKSSLLRWIAGLEGRSDGRVRVDGLDPLRCSPAQRLSRVGLVFPEPTALFSGAALTVRQEVAWSLENMAVKPAEMAARVDESLSRLGLTAVAERSPFALSGGEQQRTALACVLVLRPSLLLLDEPVARLDPAGARELTRWIRQLGLAVIWATSRCQEVEWCERWLVLEEGRCGPPQPRAGGALSAAWVRAAAEPVPGHEADLLAGLPESLSSPSPRLPAELRGEPLVELRQADGLNLALRAGERVAVLGANGAGKSTLGQLVSGLRVPTQGSVWLGGEDTRTLAPVRLAALAAYLFQEPRSQIFCSTIFDEVAFGPRQLGWTEERVQVAVAQALARAEVGADPRGNPLELPEQELLWLAFASVLAQDAPLLVLDEPTAHLDCSGWDRLHRVLHKSEHTLVLITHDLEFALEVCERVLVLDHGQLWADGPPGQVFGAGLPPGLDWPWAAQAARQLGLEELILSPAQLRRATAR